MKINSASDDAANFSIGSRMRVKLRALEQDVQNVQNGSAILNTAEGGIQGQIDLLRTIREKVIDAANDHNTEDDRRTIQKEIDHLYTQMENLAYDTDYNSKKPLLADKLIRLSDGDLEEINQTKLNLISDAEYETLDKVYGPFAAFEEYSSEIISTNAMTGGSNGELPVMSMDFSSYTDVSQLNEVGIRVGASNYVFTNDTSKNYRNAYKISLGSTVNETLNNLKSRVGGTIDGMKLQIQNYISGASGVGGSSTTTYPIWHTGAGAGISGTTSGGITNLSSDTDLDEAAKATLTVNLSNVASNSGFRFNSINFRVIAPGAETEGTVDRTLTLGQSVNGSTNLFDYSFDGSKLTFTAKQNGDNYNGYSINDGYTYYTSSTPVTTDYTAYTSFAGAIETVTPALNSTTAFWELDLSGMTVENFSKTYAGKSLQFNSNTYKFYDSSLQPMLNGFEDDSGSRTAPRTQIDINNIRQSVDSGLSLAAALKNALSSVNVAVDGDKVKFYSSYSGTSGNNSTVIFSQETTRHYDIDFSTLSVKIPDELYGKGFRAYCATDNKEWFNFVFTDGTDTYDASKLNIKSIEINVSAVSNVDELVQAIYDQANPILTGDNPKFNHHMRLAADLDKNIITLYDHRRFDVSKPPYNYQQRGAKISDGVAFKEEYDPEKRNFSVRDLVIQHTDKANMNIHIKIPQMTLDHIFDPLPIDPSTIFDYPVTTQANRDYLLGNPNPPGILDTVLKYLLDAVTLVGSQNRRLEFTLENVTTEIEKLTASESVILDADMAREMTDYTKHNVLAQAAQSMLAQANQLPSMVLSLLK